MSKGLIAVLSIVGVVILAGIIYIGSVFGFRGDCVRHEAAIKAQYEQNQNNYDNMWKKFKEMAQVPSMYVDDMKKVYDSAIQGRYGADGSKAVAQFITEHNPNLDASLYIKLQSAIEAGRNSFEANQKDLISKKQSYEITLNGNSALFVGFWFSFPKIDLAKFNIVTSDTTKEAFTTGKADEVQLRPR